MRQTPILAAACALLLAPSLASAADRAWSLEASQMGSYCVAHALAGDDRQVQVLAADGQVGLAVGSTDGAKLPQGARGKVETDTLAFDFNATYGSDDLLTSDEPLDSAAVAALRRATWIKVSVDGAKLVHVSLEDTGFGEVLDAAAACSRGKPGWWGRGARAP